MGASFAGRFLGPRGHQEEAIRSYRRCVEAPEVAYEAFPALAIGHLRGVGFRDGKRPGLDL